MKRININIDEETRRAFRIKCLEKGKTISQVLRRFIDQFIKK